MNGLVGKIDELGRITLSDQLRREAGLRAGDIVELSIDAEGRVVMASPQTHRAAEARMRQLSTLAGRLLAESGACSRDVRENLEDVGRLSETEVLAAGEETAHIVKLSQHHVEELEALDAQLADQPTASHDTFGNVIGRQVRLINELPATFRAMADEAAAHADRIAMAAEQVALIAKATTQIDRIIVMAKIVATNATIEAAHAGDYGRTFTVVAKQVAELAAEVNTVNGRIAAACAPVTASLPTLVADSRRAAKDREDSARSVSEEFGTEYGRANDIMRAVMARIRNGGQEIRRHSGELLSHLQFQDRINQQLEGVKSRCAGRCSALAHSLDLLVNQGAKAVEMPPPVDLRTSERTTVVGGLPAAKRGDRTEPVESGEIKFL